MPQTVNGTLILGLTVAGKRWLSWASFSYLENAPRQVVGRPSNAHSGAARKPGRGVTERGEKNHGRSDQDAIKVTRGACARKKHTKTGETTQECVKDERKPKQSCNSVSPGKHKTELQRRNG